MGHSHIIDARTTIHGLAVASGAAYSRFGIGRQKDTERGANPAELPTTALGFVHQLRPSGRDGSGLG